MRPSWLDRRLVATVGTGLAILVGAAPAEAQDVGQKIIRLCATAKPLAGYPPSAYAKALKELSATTGEYSECEQLIREAQLASASGRGRTAARATAAVPATQAEKRMIAEVASSGSAPVSVGRLPIRPGVVHADVASVLSDLPTPVEALLAYLLACGLVGGALLAWRRSRRNRPD